MVYDWYLSQFDRQDRTVALANGAGIDIDDLVEDIDTLNSKALANKASWGRVEDNNDSTIISFGFSSETDWENFCKEFLNPATSTLEGGEKE